MAQKVRNPIVLAYDLGGTKVHVAIVDDRGKILDEIRTPVVIEKGKKAVLRQLCDLGSELLQKYPQVKKVGVASAGPLDPEKGVLLDPTNFVSSEGSWGKVPLAQVLSKSLNRPVFLENDAAAAILAEHWIGAARKVQDSLILTLGTGLGTGMMVNGELVRAGQGQHPEGGHLILNMGDSSAPCGCGNLGCAEAYLSGRNFTRRTRTRFGKSDLTTIDLANLARKRDPRALAAFEEYGKIMAYAIYNYAVIYCPKVVILAGSFANAADLFLPSTKTYLEPLLARRRQGVDLLPKIAVSQLQNSSGVLGAAYVAFHRKSPPKTKKSASSR